jgi:hypothetical protein
MAIVQASEPYEYTLIIDEKVAKGKSKLSSTSEPLREFKELSKQVTYCGCKNLDANETIIGLYTYTNALEPAPVKELFILTEDILYKLITNYKLTEFKNDNRIKYNYVVDSVYEFDDETLSMLYMVYGTNMNKHVKYDEIQSLFSRGKLKLKLKWKTEQIRVISNIASIAPSKWSVINDALKKYDNSIIDVSTNYDTHRALTALRNIDSTLNKVVAEKILLFKQYREDAVLEITYKQQEVYKDRFIVKLYNYIIEFVFIKNDIYNHIAKYKINSIYTVDEIDNKEEVKVLTEIDKDKLVKLELETID